MVSVSSIQRIPLDVVSVCSAQNRRPGIVSGFSSPALGESSLANLSVVANG